MTKELIVALDNLAQLIKKIEEKNKGKHDEKKRN